MGFKILRIGSPLNCTYYEQVPSFLQQRSNVYKKSKNGFADYPVIPRTVSYEPERTP